MLRAILNQSWRQHPTRHQLYGHQPPITKTIQVRRTRHAGHCWRSRDELISDVLLWTPTYGRAKAGRPARTYIQQLCEDTGSGPEDLPEAMNDREKWHKRIRDIWCLRHDMMMMMINYLKPYHCGQVVWNRWSPVDCDCRVRQLHLRRRKKPFLTSVLNTKLLLEFDECEVDFRCHYSQIHFDR